jgi:hypothetical protein
MGRNENEPHPMSPDMLKTGDKPSRCLIGEGRWEGAGQQPAPPHRSGGVGVDGTSASSVKESWESSSDGCETQPTAQAGWASEAGGVAGAVGVLHSSQETPVMGVEPRRDTCSKVRSDGGRWLRKEIRCHEACPHQPWPEVPCGNAGTGSNPESRIWEIRPFGSMRGGRELVIGSGAFHSNPPAYSTQSSVAPVKLIGTRVRVPPVELGCSRRNTTSTASPRGGVGS